MSSDTMLLISTFKKNNVEPNFLNIILLWKRSFWVKKSILINHKRSDFDNRPEEISQYISKFEKASQSGVPR